MASSQSLPGTALSTGNPETSDDPFVINPVQRPRTTSPNPNRQNAPIPRSVPNSRDPSPNRPPLLHEGLVGKLRILRADALTHPTDMLVCPSDSALSANWCALTARIHEAAGPKLSTTISNRYSAGISNPPAKLWSEYSDVNDIESPFKSFFDTVKHSLSFEMANCDWLAHSCVPSYSKDGYTTGEGVGCSEDIWIQERNHAKYNSVYLALKKAHLVALVHWTRKFSVTIPQFQHDGEFYTPRDDAILTLAAVVDFFNHPVWGARRCNIIERVDIIIDPTDDGVPYVEAYDFAWHGMNMQLYERDIPPSPGSRRGFLLRPFLAYRPPLPARDPYANFGPPKMTQDVLVTTETPDNSQQVAESQVIDPLEHAKMDEDGDSIFGDFMQNAVADFHGSDVGVGNSPFRHEEIIDTSRNSPQPTKEVDEKEISTRTSEQEGDLKIQTPEQTLPKAPAPLTTSFSETRKPSNNIPSPLSTPSQNSLSPPPINTDKKPPFRSSSPSSESIPQSPIPKVFKSPTDDEFATPIIPGLTLLKTALTNTSPQLSPASGGSGNGERKGEGEVGIKITVTPPIEAVWDRASALKERKSSEMRISSPLAGSVVYFEGRKDGEDGEGDEFGGIGMEGEEEFEEFDSSSSSMLEVPDEETPPPRKVGDLNRVSPDEIFGDEEEEDEGLETIEEEDEDIEPDLQEVTNSDSDSDLTTDPDASEEEGPRPNLLRKKEDNSDSEDDDDGDDDDGYHPKKVLDATETSSQEPEDDDLENGSDSASDSDSEFEGFQEEQISPVSPAFPKNPRVLKREVAGLGLRGDTFDGCYWNQPRSTRKRKRRDSDVD